MWIVWCYLLRRDLIWLSGEHMRCGFSGSCRCSGGTPRLTVLEQYTHAVLRGRVVDAPKPPSRRTAYRLVHVPQATKNTKTWRKLGELRRKLDEYLSRAIRAADPPLATLIWPLGPAIENRPAGASPEAPNA